MKNLLTCTILLILGSVLFTSCNQGISLTKRHYRNGYHVEYSSKRPEVKPKGSPAPVIASQEKPGNDLTLPENAGNDTKSSQPELADKASKVESNKPTVNQKSVKHSSVMEKAISDKVKSDKKANSPLLNMKDKFRPAQSMNSDGDAHSLFWIVITIIAILYLIALVTGGWGLGGAIHVLLVIALVLFILWLLRII